MGVFMRKSDKQILYMFWNYDICPFMLSGIVDYFCDSGRVAPKGYQGMSFQPLAIIPDIAGKIAHDSLTNIKNQYKEKSLALKKQYQDAALRNINLKPLVK